MAVRDFDADSDEIKSNKFKSFKGKAGETVRVAIVYKNPKSLFKGAETHYGNRYFMCKSTDKKKEICCTHNYKGNKPRWRVGCVLLKYIISSEGKINDWKIEPWVFSDTMYQKLKNSNKEFPLATHDIKLTCTNEEYQNIDIQSCKDALWLRDEKFKAKVLEAAEPWFDDVASNIASDLTVTEIREVLGADTPGSDDAAEDIDLDGIVDGID